MKYATALKDKNLGGEDVPNPKDLVSAKYTAIVHNIHAGYHRAFDTCDILYSEPAWRHGYNVFMAKTDQPGKSFDEYVRDICAFIKSANKPAAIIAGKADAKIYAKHLSFTQTEILLIPHKCKAVVLWINMPPMKIQPTINNMPTTDTLLHGLAAKFNKVGDFCAGYGKACLFFYDANKSFVASDVNPQYISHIATTYENLQ